MHKRQNLRNSLRKTMRQKRMALSQSQHACWSSAIVKHLQENLLPQSIGFCMPIFNEADILPLIFNYQKQGIATAMAKVVEKNAPLIFIPWKKNAPLAKDICGILAPIENQTMIPQMLLVPLLAFDAQGFRLGYGGGYFDRTLAQNCFYSVGVGFEMNRVQSVWPQEHDQALHAVVTEKGFFEFPRST